MGFKSALPPEEYNCKLSWLYFPSFINKLNWIFIKHYNNLSCSFFSFEQGVNQPLLIKSDNKYLLLSVCICNCKHVKWLSCCNGISLVEKYFCLKQILGFGIHWKISRLWYSIMLRVVFFFNHRLFLGSVVFPEKLPYFSDYKMHLYPPKFGRKMGVHFKLWR